MRKLAVCLVLGGLTLPASADSIFGVYAGFGTWQQSYGGDVTSGIAAVNVETDLGLDDVDNNVLYLAVEHGVPVLPNVRLQSTQLKVDLSHIPI